MPKLSTILNDSDEITIPTGDEDLTIEYYPSRLTPKLLSEMQHLIRTAEKHAEDEEKQQEILGKVYGLLLSFFKSWDLEDEVSCGKCDECRYRAARSEWHEKEGHSAEERAHFAEEDGALSMCSRPRVITLPLTAESLESIPYWLFKEITEKFINPNRAAPKTRKKRNSRI